MTQQITTSTIEPKCGNQAHELFALANRRKLSDIFANGFTIPDNMKALVQQSAMPKKTNMKGIKSSDILSLFDIVLIALSDDNKSPYSNATHSSYVYSVVFRQDTAISKKSYPLGFTNKTVQYNGIAKENSLIYSVALNGNLDFCFVKKRIDRYLTSVNLLFQRALSTNKNVLKSDFISTTLTQTANQPEIARGIKKMFVSQKKDPTEAEKQKKNEAINALILQMSPNIESQMQEIINSNVSSILNLPEGCELTFPTGDLTQLQILYKSMQEELGAVLQMPLTKLFGTPPVGFQSTGEYDRLSYEQTLDSIANEYCVPVLKEVASILKYSQQEIDQIKYISTYQMEMVMKMINATAGVENTQVKKMLASYIETKTGIPPEQSDLQATVVTPQVEIPDSNIETGEIL